VLSRSKIQTLDLLTPETAISGEGPHALDRQADR